MTDELTPTATEAPPPPAPAAPHPLAVRVSELEADAAALRCHCADRRALALRQTIVGVAGALLLVASLAFLLLEIVHDNQRGRHD